MEQQLHEPEQSASAVITPEESISPEEMAAYIDDRLTPDERASVEERLARSPALRKELVAAARIVSTVEAARERRPISWKPTTMLVTAAAAAILLVAIPRFMDFRTPPVAAERRAEAEDGGHVQLVTPPDASVVSPTSVAFSWHPQGDASYRITVADGTGATVWTTLTSDTTVTLPPAIVLQPASHYYWYVDASRADGSSVTSGSQSFMTKPR
jgi:hypothetical protein